MDAKLSHLREWATDAIRTPCVCGCAWNRDCERCQLVAIAREFLKVTEEESAKPSLDLFSGVERQS